jgi:hypothetical protein
MDDLEFKTKVCEDLGYIRGILETRSCERHEKRLEGLERKVNYGTGIMACVMALIGYFK